MVIPISTSHKLFVAVGQNAKRGDGGESNDPAEGPWAGE
jgi:hypothetical protein